MSSHKIKRIKSAQKCVSVSYTYPTSSTNLNNIFHFIQLQHNLLQFNWKEIRDSFYSTAVKPVWVVLAVTCFATTVSANTETAFDFRNVLLSHVVWFLPTWITYTCCWRLMIRAVVKCFCGLFFKVELVKSVLPYHHDLITTNNYGIKMPKFMSRICTNQTIWKYLLELHHISKIDKFNWFLRVF